MTNRIFHGTVRQTRIIKEEADQSPLLRSYISGFEQYWQTGFSPLIGKDIATSTPNPPTGHRHAHLRPDDFSLSAHRSGTEECWNKWQYGQTSTVRLVYPTSDRCLFYIVDVQRNAYVFHFQDSGSHDYMKTADFSLHVERVSNMVPNDLMPWNEHHELFHEKWLKDKE